MDTRTMDTLAEDRDEGLEDPSSEYLPGRPRRRLLTPLTVPLLGLLLVAVGFLVGVEVERHHGSTGSSSALATPSRALLGAGGFSGAGGASGASGKRAGGGSRSGFPSGGFPGGSSAGGFGGAGGGTAGTVSSVSGRTIYLKTTSGNTIKVTLSSATKLKKDLSVKRGSIHPGDSITVEGITGKGGAVAASSISDTGS